MLNFSNREKNTLIFGICFVVLFFVWQLGMVPFYEKRKTLHRVLNEKQMALEEMLKLQQAYAAVSDNVDMKTQTLLNRDKAFTLFSFIDEQAEQSGVKENVVYMKPFSKSLEKSAYELSTVKVKLNDIYLKELVDFLFRIESSKKDVTITALSLSKFGKDEIKLEALIETETRVPKG